MTLERADGEATSTDKDSPRGRIRATIKRSAAEGIQIKGPQREGKGDNKESGCMLYKSRARIKRRMATIRRADAEGPAEG